MIGGLFCFGLEFCIGFKLKVCIGGGGSVVLELILELGVGTGGFEGAGTTDTGRGVTTGEIAERQS